MRDGSPTKTLEPMIKHSRRYILKRKTSLEIKERTTNFKNPKLITDKYGNKSLLIEVNTIVRRKLKNMH